MTTVENSALDVRGLDPRAVEALGRASYQVTVIVCDHCKSAYQPAGADLVRIDSATLDTACCDAQHIDLTHGCGSHRGETHAGETYRGGTHVGETHGGGTHGCETHVGDEPGRTAPRATQSVPPAIRRQVMLRDQRCCQVPGCRNTLGLDVHHIVPRADGGTHHAHDLIAICSAYQRTVHRGQLLVSGRAPDDVVFQHPDGTPYGGEVSARSSDVCEKVNRGLIWLGFKMSEARRALLECRRAGEVGEDAEALLRRALARI